MYPVVVQVDKRCADVGGAGIAGPEFRLKLGELLPVAVGEAFQCLLQLFVGDNFILVIADRLGNGFHIQFAIFAFLFLFLGQFDLALHVVVDEVAYLEKAFADA